ncbi:penicillin-binding transpeptidase domain-containing protein [Paenibacillus allorhizosphaerae]|uniref:Beta-lactam-inducible penicillin-binding protein n=1 Tax=Paenibacillus allorhizosphaerae TaxID=2849866 RepID=A0ABM8VQ63_9BACL|nr:penicillin-binding transpeptidase domain-containing protein [Paenibacillus allorhizosphaerae]CAG7653756.1 Beta-lactam-inducible penicillin-binding protein [Paenibacillus allorhizosphaerae]
MKKTKLLLVLVLMTVAVGCRNKPPSAEERMQSFLTAWAKHDYEVMYEALSSRARSAMPKEAFVQRHQSIYEGIEASRLAPAIVTDAAPGNAASAQSGKADRKPLPFHMEMDTFAGPVAYDSTAVMVKEQNGWFVDWTPSMIFPQLGEGDKVRALTLKAKRGEIVDRAGRGLAVNEDKLEIGLVPKQVSEPASDSIRQLAELLKMSEDDLDKKLKAPWVKPDLFVPVALLAKDDERLRQILAVKGVATQTKKVRSYPYQEAAAHLTGYVGKINAEEWEKLKIKGYGQDDLIGKAGLEQVLEEKLRGKDGGRIYITDTSGQEKAELARRNAEDGATIHLTIDGGLQSLIYDQMASDAGVGAAIQPLTGEVLALVSTPSYDPNAFVSGVTPEQWKQWTEDVRKPLLNRFARTYSPGSAFKPITGAIALQTGVITPELTRTIVGKQWKKDGSWGNYSVTRVSEASTSVDLLKGLLYSDNIYFAQTALELGSDRFLAEAGKFGFDEKLPLPYPFDKSTLVAKKMNNEIQLADSGYGQGEVQMNPLHVALTYTVFVSGGDMIAPVLIQEEGGPKGGTVWKKQVVRPDVASVIQQDMIQVIENASGTGRGARIKGITLAGKTGTAERKQSQGVTGKEDGWFVAYNTDQPKLLLALMLEDVQDHGGSHHLAPKVKQVFTQYLKP